MRSLLNKELTLAVSPLTWMFLLGTFMTLLPGYPILLSAFFVCLGIFYSFQGYRESNDILYTALLPIRKADAVRAKYLIVLFFQGLAFLIICVLTVLRMTILSSAGAYLSNFLNNPNPVFLAFVLMVFLSFNTFFVCGFFRTAYKFGWPFIGFVAAAVLLVLLSEILPHVPGLEFLHSTSGERLGVQFAVFGIAVLVFVIGTFLAEQTAEKRFESIDL